MARRFWQLETIEGDFDDQWIVDDDAKLYLKMNKLLGRKPRHRYPNIKEVKPWAEPFPVKCVSAGPYHDMPCGVHICMALSDRFKQLLEEVAPGTMQFLPLQMMYRRKPLPCGPYWAGNGLKVYDCIDAEPSGCSPSRFPDCYLVDEEATLCLFDSKIPEDASIFQLHKRRHFWIVTERVKRRMQAAKLTGIEYVRVRTS